MNEYFQTEDNALEKKLPPDKGTVKRNTPVLLLILEMSNPGVGTVSAWCSGWRRSPWFRLAFSGQLKLAHNSSQGCYPELYHSTWPTAFTRPSLSSNPLPRSFQSDISRMPHPCPRPPQVSLSRGCIVALHVYGNQVQSSGKPGTAWPCQTATGLTRFVFHHSFPHPEHPNWEPQFKRCGKMIHSPERDRHI